jgi:hypothetical protein
MSRIAIAVAALAALTVSCGVDSQPGAIRSDAPLAYTTRPRVVEADLIPFVVSDIRFTTTVERPGDPDLYGVDQDGRVLRIERPTVDDVRLDGTLTGPVGDRSTLDDVVLDIIELTESAGEEGLVGLAFDPSGRLAYIHHSRIADGHSVVAEYQVGADGVFDPATRRELFVVEQYSPNHNAGQLLFGPDGYLYAAFGDGSIAADQYKTALDLGSPLGKILRVDPTATADAPYTVPADNPFVDTPGADPRIWSLGLRNPFSFSFDQLTGDMWVADVGQARFEEVNFSIATNGVDAGRGVDYGWSQYEALTPYRGDQETDNHQPPRFFYEHPNPECGAVADGLVVRDSRVPLLDGWYTYGDWCAGLVWARDTLQLDAEPVVLGTMPGFTQMLQMADGNVYASSQLGSIALVAPG